MGTVPMKEPVKKQLRPQYADMMQFRGYQNAQEIFDWCGKVFFVGTGYEHHLRRSNEHDRSNGHIHEHAAAFLVLTQSDGTKVRLDTGDWVVLGGKHGDELIKMTPDEVEEFYVDLDPVDKTETPKTADRGY